MLSLRNGVLDVRGLLISIRVRLVLSLLTLQSVSSAALLFVASTNQPMLISKTKE